MRKESLHRHGHFIGQLRGWHSKNVLVLLTCLRDLMSGWVSRNVMRSGTSSSMDSLAATLPALPATHHLAQLLSCFAHRVCACSATYAFDMCQKYCKFQASQAERGQGETKHLRGSVCAWGSLGPLPLLERAALSPPHVRPTPAQQPRSSTVTASVILEDHFAAIRYQTSHNISKETIYIYIYIQIHRN